MTAVVQRRRASVFLCALGLLVPVALAGPAVAAATSDLAVTKVDSPDPVAAGTNLTYTLLLQNNGPDPAANVLLTDALPAGTTFVSFTAPAGWTPTTPAVGATGTVSAAIATMPVGTAVFTLVVRVAPYLVGSPSGSIPLSNPATATTTSPDPGADNNASTSETTVIAVTDFSVTKTDLTDPVAPGGNIIYSITVQNNGPSDFIVGMSGLPPRLTDTTPAGTTFVAITPPANALCGIIPAVGGTGAVDCITSPVAPAGSTQNFTYVVRVDSSVAPGATITNSAGITQVVTDPNAANNTATATTTVSSATAVRVRSIEATAARAGNLVRWRTASEIDALGFHVYRQSPNGKRVRVNRTLIAAKGRGLYSFLDRKAPRAKSVRYWLQVVNLDGSRSWHGPAVVRALR